MIVFRMLKEGAQSPSSERPTVKMDKNSSAGTKGEVVVSGGDHEL